MEERRSCSPDVGKGGGEVDGEGAAEEGDGFEVHDEYT